MRVLWCVAPRVETIGLGGGEENREECISKLDLTNLGAGDLQNLMDTKPPPSKGEIATVSAVVVAGK